MGQRLGQHFLVNEAVGRRILDALELKDGDTVVEIGPGRGALTRELGSRNYELGEGNRAGHGVKIIGIEKDKKLARDLEVKCKKQSAECKIIEGDVLRVLPSVIHNSLFITRGYKLVGNIPYYITGRILRMIGELQRKPEIAVLMVQEEVAERICAKPPKMNLLAASVQIWAEPEVLFKVSRADFRPAPKVDSAVVKLGIKNKEVGIKGNDCHGDYYKLIRILFKQPRKTILNNLQFTIYNFQTSKEKILRVLQEVGIKPGDRPQDLDIEAIKCLAVRFGDMLLHDSVI